MISQKELTEIENETSGAVEGTWTEEIWGHGFRHTKGLVAEIRNLRAENEDLKRQLEFYISRNLELEDVGKEWTETTIRGVKVEVLE